MPTVAELMSRSLVQVEPDATVAEAASLMAQRRVGSVLVMNGDRLAGIFTERDMVRAISQSVDAPADAVTHWMTRGPRTAESGDDAAVALQTMLTGGFRHLPVLDGGRLVGMLSMRDVAALGVEEAEGPPT